MVLLLLGQLWDESETSARSDVTRGLWKSLIRLLCGCWFRSRRAGCAADYSEILVAGERSARSRHDHGSRSGAGRDDCCHIRILRHGELSSNDTVKGHTSRAGETLA